MQNKSPLRFTKTTPYDIYYKDIVPNQHLKTLSGGQSQQRTSTHFTNIKPKIQLSPNGTITNDKKVHSKLKNLQQKLEGMQALLKKKGDQSRCQTFTSRTNPTQSNCNENTTLNIMNGSVYSPGFDIRTTCPNGFKKFQQIHQPALRTTSNLSHLTKYGFSPAENKIKNASIKNSQFLQNLRTKKPQVQSPLTPTLQPKKLDEFPNDVSFDYYSSNNKINKDFFLENQTKNIWKTKVSPSQKNSELSVNQTQQSSSISNPNAQKSENLNKQFQIVKRLGKGKFGQVFLAQHKITKSLYALKKISKQKVRQQKMVNQFLDQIKLHSSLQHPNIVKFFGFFQETDDIYLILQYIHGQTLFDYLNQKQKIPLKQTVNYLRDTIQAITYLHDRSIAHRDIKPQNILLTSEGVAKVCDFGWSALIQTSRKTYCGTFDYVPPEILQRKNYDLSVDLWCLGILTYELLCGNVPFDGDGRAIKMNKILSVDKTKINFPAQFTAQTKDFIQNLVRKDPTQRIKSKDLLRHSFFTLNPPTQIKKK